MASPLNRPITVPARALSYESPTVPTDRSMPASAGQLVLQRPVEYKRRPAIAVGNERLGGTAVARGLLERVEYKVGVHRRAHAPVHDDPCEDGHDQRDVHEPRRVARYTISLRPGDPQLGFQLLGAVLVVRQRSTGSVFGRNTSFVTTNMDMRLLWASLPRCCKPERRDGGLTETQAA